MGEVQCWDGDGVFHPTLAGTVLVHHCEVQRTYEGQGKVKLKLFGDVAHIKERLRSVQDGAEWFQVITDGNPPLVTSFFGMRIDSIQEVWCGAVLCRIFYDRSEPAIKTYVQTRHRDKRYNWSMTNP